jgi:hypothetical protein
MRNKLALLSLSTALAAIAITASPAAALTRPQAFSLLSVTQSFQPIGGFQFDREPQPGDRFGFTEALYRWAGQKRGARVGRSEILCTFSKVAVSERGLRAMALCTGQFFLPAGSVLVHGFVAVTEGPGRFTIPIVGGTGLYANTRGFLKIRDLGTGDEDKSNNEFHLMP